MNTARLQSITRTFSDAAARIDELGGRLKFDLSEEGVVFLNGTVTPCAVSNSDSEADCVVEISIEVLEDMMAGKIDSRSAFIQGRMCLVGDMGLALKLAALLNSASSGT